MSLKVELKPGERLIIGNCVITNTDQRVRLYIDGKSPILREKDVLTATSADTPAKRIYLAIQLMYLDENVGGHEARYFALVDDFIGAAPSAVGLVDAINCEILAGSLYRALKCAKRLIEYEQELLRT